MTSTRNVDPEVYEAYLQGKYFLEQGRPESLREARSAFARALALDDRFALAHVGLAEVYGLQAYLFDDPTVYARLQEQEARAAIALDPMLGNAHALLGDVLRYYRWDWAGAEQEYLRGIETTPGDVAIRRKYWAHLAGLGRFEEARRQLDFARPMDPLSAALPTDASYQALMEGDTERARLEVSQALKLDPKLPWAQAVLWHLLDIDGGPEKERDGALAAFLRGMGYEEMAGRFEATAISIGYRDRLLALGRELEDRSKNERVSIGLGGAILVAAGDLDRAEKWLLRAFDKRDPELVWLAQDISWVELRKRPSIAALVREMGLRPDSPKTRSPQDQAE